MTWIVTGGAGYIGAHVVHRLVERRHDVVVLDDLSTGRVDRLPAAVPVVKGSVTSADDLDRLFGEHPAAGVVHLAAVTSVDESVRDPDRYRRVNVDGVAALTAAMRRAGVRRLLFASSAAVYGDTGGRAAREDQPLRPVNPYGSTKRAGERIVARAGLDALVFRKFNVLGAGSHPHALDPTAGLLPAALRAAAGSRPLIVRGGRYATPDGSPVRDFLHVADVADAYLRGVESTVRGVVNLGSGRGTSVLELARMVGRVTGAESPHEFGPPRPGDAPAVVAAVDRAREQGFAARRSLAEAVASAWAAWPRPDDAR